MINNIDNTSKEIPSWPPVYNIRESGRAKRPFLQVTRERGLEIVLPPRKRRINIEKLLNDKRAWIERTLKKMFQGLPNFNKPLILERPEYIECQALLETWFIVYEPKPLAKKLKASLKYMPEKTLLLKGKTDDLELCCRLLKKQLIKEAHSFLIPWLQELSFLTELKFDRAIIRGQSTLWGSCNAHKTISLNYKLLFLPRALAKHILLHELCHLKYLNHSENFWQYLRYWDENCNEHRKQLKTADRFIPRWLTVI